MSGFLLDTNVPSELTRPSPPSVDARWVDANSGNDFHLSAVSIGELHIGELHKGFMLPAPGKRRIDLERWGKLSAERQLRGAKIGTADGLIAATALEHGLTLVTRNTGDFAELGLTLLSPWE